MHDTTNLQTHMRMEASPSLLDVAFVLFALLLLVLPFQLQRTLPDLTLGLTSSTGRDPLDDLDPRQVELFALVFQLVLLLQSKVRLVSIDDLE